MDDTHSETAYFHQRICYSLQGKAGMEYLVRVAAKAYTKQGINFNAIIPGNVLAGALQSPSLLYAPSRHPAASLPSSLKVVLAQPQRLIWRYLLPFQNKQ